MSNKAILAFLFGFVGTNVFANQLDNIVVELKTHCEMHVPSAWGGKTMTWSGFCKNNMVDGNGVATIFQGSKVVAMWYGDTVGGAPSTGIVEFPGKPSNVKTSTFALIPEKEILKDPSEKTDAVVQFQSAYNALEIIVEQAEYAKNSKLADKYAKKLRDISKFFKSN